MLDFALLSLRKLIVNDHLAQREMLRKLFYDAWFDDNA
jgi:hypothetical protein